MRIYTAIHFLFGFIFGSVFTSFLCTFAFSHAIEHAPLEKVSARAVRDVEQAYQNQLSKDDAFSACMEQNTRLKTAARKHQ